MLNYFYKAIEKAKLKQLIIFLMVLILSFDCLICQSNEKSEIESDTSKSNLLPALGYTGLYFGTSMYILSKTWYKDRKVAPFHFYNDNSGYLQMDKFGHIFGSYIYSSIGYKYLTSIGYTKNEALLFGGGLGFILQAPIEIMDGIHENYGFSFGDIAANSMGSLLVIGQELLFDEQIVKYKFSYSETEYSRKSNGYLGTNSLNRILKDYNGQTYWLSCPINQIAQTQVFPNWLCISAGYSANGMYGELENIKEYKGVIIPETRRYRQLLFSLDIDWSKIKTNSEVLNTILEGLNYIKLPFPALEYNSKGNLNAYWVYF